MGTKGRLRRSFPGRILRIKDEIFEQSSFQSTVAHTLAQMSHQAAAGTLPQVLKAGKPDDEDRDTNHPKMVTELFFAFLGPFAETTDEEILWKNTREEVLYSDSLQPWRRSPLWLFIRVSIQLHLERSYRALTMTENLYKVCRFLPSLLQDRTESPAPYRTFRQFER